MYAIFETGGKQYKAEKGDVIFVEKLHEEPGKTVTFDALVVADGDDVQIGTPIVQGAKVRAKVEEHGKQKKVVLLKYKPKRNYRKKQGHRQPYTKIEIVSISTAAGKSTAETAAENLTDKSVAAAAKPAAAKEPAAAAKPAAAKKPAAKSAAAKPAAAKKPAAKSAAAKPAAAKKPAAKSAAAKPAAAKKPAAKSAAAKPAAAKKPAAKPAKEKEDK